MKRCLVHPPHDCSCAEYELRAEVERLNSVIAGAERFLVDHGYTVQAAQLRARKP